MAGIYLFNLRVYPLSEQEPYKMTKLFLENISPAIYGLHVYMDYESVKRWCPQLQGGL